MNSTELFAVLAMTHSGRPAEYECRVKEVLMLGKLGAEQ